MTDTITTKPFASQAQQRWAFATGQPFAKRWVSMTDFSTLPKRAKRLMRIRRKAWSPQARAAALEARRRNMLARVGQALPNADARNLASARAEAARLGKVHHTPVAALPKAPKGGKGGGKKGGGKGGKTQTPEQLARQAQRDQEHAQDRARRDRMDAERAQRQQTADQRRAALDAQREQDRQTRLARQAALDARRERLDKLRQQKRGGGGSKKPTTTTSAAEQRAQTRFDQQQQDRRDRIARQQLLDAQRAQDRADRIAARREARVGKPRNNVVTSGAGTNRAVHKAIPPIPEPTRTLNAGHTGVMVALIPDSAAVQALADQRAVTEPADQLHLTLVFLGDSTEQPLATNKAQLIDAVRQWAAQHGTPLEGTINGAGRFFHAEDDETNAVFVSPDVPGLPELRQSLCDWLERSGFDYAQNHGFTPHITVAYVPLDAPTPDIRVDTPVSFPSVTLGWGDEQYDMPMSATTKAASDPGDFLVVEDPEKPSTWHLQVKRNGTPDHGLMGAAHAALTTGFRGNVYQGPNKAEALAKLRKLYASEGMEVPASKAASFTVYKDARGGYRWVMFSSNAFRDRDNEIVSTKALAQDVARADQDHSYGPLRWWHMGVPFGPGVDLGTCDYNAMVGKMLIESGTFASPAIGAAIAAKANQLQGSIGFTHPADEPDRDGVFWHIHRFERSLVPAGKAANPYTTLYVQEHTPMDETKLKALAELLNIPVDQVQGLVTAAQTKEAKLEQAGVAFKSADPTSDPDPTTTTTAKASADMSAVTEDALPPDAENPAEDTAEGGMEEPGEENMLTMAECQQIAQMTAQAVIEQLMPHLDIGKKMDEVKGMLGGVAGAYSKKDAEQAELKTQIEQLTTRLKELEGDQPKGGGYRASLDTATVVTKETPTPQADPLNDFISGFILAHGGQPAVTS